MNDFGVIIGCCKRDYLFAKGTIASVRHFLGDVPICLLVDGTFPTDEMNKAYGVQTLYRADVKDDFLRSRSFGWGLTKMVCFWESPFERFLWLDADTVVWGDIRKKLFREGNWDIYTDKSDGSFSREDVTEWFFDVDKLEQRYPGFNWQRYAGSYYCTGIWASRRGVFPLQEYKDILNVVDEDPSLFKCAEMGLLNFMIFRAMEEGRAKVASGAVQVIVHDFTLEELDRRYNVSHGEPVEVSDDPVVLHYTIPKPVISEGPVVRPMTYFRRLAMKDGNGISGLRAELHLRLEDVCWKFSLTLNSIHTSIRCRGAAPIRAILSSLGSSSVLPTASAGR
jgi:hypothetical protein